MEVFKQLRADYISAMKSGVNLAKAKEAFIKSAQTQPLVKSEPIQSNVVPAYVLQTQVISKQQAAGRAIYTIVFNKLTQMEFVGNSDKQAKYYASQFQMGTLLATKLIDNKVLPIKD